MAANGLHKRCVWGAGSTLPRESPPTAISWNFSFFCVEEAFGLMLAAVFELFHSIFFAFATSIRISRVGVPPGLELGLVRTL